ncbi:MAG: TonB-dependent receptor, partial [Gelidibacter sp.]
EGIFSHFPKVSLKKGVIKANDLLQQSLYGGNFNFEFTRNNTIVIRDASNYKSENRSQERQIEGTLTDGNGMPLVGVTVIVEGTQRGVVTNFDGVYKIVLKTGENVLVFSSLGYKTERITIGDQTIINLTMKEDFSQLDEIVLIGYGEQKREDVTGAISSINTAEVVQATIGSVGFDRALGGLVKGVQVTQPSGRPGAPIELNIRGLTSPFSPGTNQPLFVIDGVPFNTDGLQTGNPLLTLNPNDIERFDILRDAAATSIYGSRGANGVVIIETKKGKRGQTPTLTVGYTTTLAEPINTIDVLNASQYRSFYDQLIGNTVNAMNAGQIDPFFAFDLANIGNVELDFDTFQVSYNGLRDEYFGTADTNWSDVVFRDLAVTKQANLSLLGGSERSSYAFRLGFVDQDGLTVRDGIKQYTIGMSLGSELSSRVKIGGSMNLGHVESNSGEDDGTGQYTVISSIARARPDLPVYGQNGRLLGQPDFSYGFETFEPNPLMRLQNKTNNKSYNFIGNSFIEVEAIKNLKFKADINTSIVYNDNSSFTPKITQTDLVSFPNESFLSESNALTSNLVTNLTANYDLKLSEHRLYFLAGAAWDRTNINTRSQNYSGFPDDDVLINAGSAESVFGYFSNRLELGLNSFFGRFTYGYKNLYNATVNIRSDRSSLFGPGNQRATFPSLSLSWNINNEKFLEQSEKINTLRLRASAGRVGSTNTAAFAYTQFFMSASNNLYNGDTAIVPSNVFPNTNIGWEETSEINLGLDFELFNSRLRGNIDVYDRKTEGALSRRPIPLELGPNMFTDNFVDVTNKGIELSIGGDIIKTEDFTWAATVNWSMNRNKLDKFNGAVLNESQLDNFIEGEPVGTIRGYRVTKIFQNQDEVDALNGASPFGFYDQFSTGVGDYMYEDINGDGEISIKDRTIIGNVQPDYFGGISNTITYKNFSLSALLQYSVGAERAWEAIPFGTYNFLGENKYSEYALNTWSPENPNARYAKPLYFDPSVSSRLSDRYVYDASYLRLRSLQLRYNFDRLLLEKLGVGEASLTLTGSNLATWTKWPGLDPETFSERGGVSDQVNNEDPYPLAKSFSIGLQVQF